MILYCVILEDQKDDNDVESGVCGYDIFGIYSSKEKAIKALEWRRRSDGRYDGVSGQTYSCGFIVSRGLDCNLPENEEKEDLIKENLQIEQYLESNDFFKR